MRVLALTRYPRTGASSRQRFLVYFDYLASRGIEVTAEPFFSQEYISRLNAGRAPSIRDLAWSYAKRVQALLSKHHYDIVWIEKEALPQCPFWVEALLLRNAKVLLDLDDAWHLRYSKGWRRIMSNKIARLGRRANAVVVANQQLERWALGAGIAAASMCLVPTGLDIAKYQATPDPDLPFTVGWIGSPSTVEFLTTIDGALRSLSNEGVQLLVIGADRKPGRLANIAVEQHDWSEDSEAELLSRCHVGIGPLPDEEWCKYKSGYKLIQYMAVGRPSVASPVGANKLVVAEGETGFFAESAEDWIRQILRLRDDSELRKRMGAQARARCERLFSVEALGRDVADAMMKLQQQAKHKLRSSTTSAD
ncbi:MAG: glycosyltransferase family 4 protein [Hyphomicrobiaceae bacterium]